MAGLLQIVRDLPISSKNFKVKENKTKIKNIHSFIFIKSNLLFFAFFFTFVIKSFTKQFKLGLMKVWDNLCVLVKL